jgi:hypothetical protein
MSLPRGERGLKDGATGRELQTWEGRSPRGERGLKVRQARDQVGRVDVAPHAGAWIENTISDVDPVSQTSRSPRGERGLQLNRVCRAKAAGDMERLRTL